MILMDKIKKFLFTEEEIEEYVEDEPQLEKIVQPHVQKPQRKPVIEEARQEKVVAKPLPKQETSTIDIKVDIPIKEKKIEKRLQPIERKDFEMPQVISPINGLKEDNVTSEKTNTNTVSIRPKKVKDPFTTVISPYYGVDELEEIATKAQTQLASDSIKEEVNTSLYEKVEKVDDEVENISLDKIVSSEMEDEEEMIQFSLFGDNAPLSELGDQELAKENLDDDKKDDLPF